MKNFMITGTQRTGSSAFAELIGFHPAIACGWEWTQSVPVWQKLKAAERGLHGDFSLLPAVEQNHMHQVLTSTCEWLGFRRLFRASDKWLGHPRMAPALWVDRLEAHLNWLRSCPHIHVIHLVRRDNLAWLKSKVFARSSNLYARAPYPKDMVVRIPVTEAVKRVRSKCWVDSRLATLSVSNPFMRIYYEDFVTDKIAAGSEALRFLGCDPNSIMTRAYEGRQRQSSGITSEGLQNYEDVYRALKRFDLLEARI